MKLLFIIMLWFERVCTFSKPLLFLNKNDAIKSMENKKIITLTPGGIGGFYMLGVNTYINKHYDLNNYHFVGASAGAWNTLLYAYNKDDCENIVDILLQSNFTAHSIYQLQYQVKNLLLNNFKTEDFDFTNIYICVCTLTTTGIKSIFIHDISTLEQAIDCCISSSHIPFITGGLLHEYSEKYLFDGGMLPFPPKFIDYYFQIHCGIWGTKLKDMLTYPDNTTYFKDLYLKGYADTKENKDLLDTYFTPRNHSL